MRLSPLHGSGMRMEADSMCPREKPYQSFSEHVDKYFESTIFSYKVKSSKYARL
jgi:hypothetical protein